MSHIVTCVRPMTAPGFDLSPSALETIHASAACQSTSEQTFVDEMEGYARAPVTPPRMSQVSIPRYRFTPLRTVTPPSASPDPARFFAEYETEMALTPTRPSTSPSDNAVIGKKRKEIGAKRRELAHIPINPMTTVHEDPIDSPTIPGRPPLNVRPSKDSPSHERSSSAPGANWKSGPLGDALMSQIGGPASTSLERLDILPKSQKQKIDLPRLDVAVPVSTFIKPLSPIAPYTLPGLHSTDSASSLRGLEDIPPAVPPKSPSLNGRVSPSMRQEQISRKGSPMPTSSRLERSPMTPLSRMERSPMTPLSRPDRSPMTPLSQVERTPSPMSIRSMRQNTAGGPIQSQVITDRNHVRTSSETSVLNRGRPTKRMHTRHRNGSAIDISPREEEIKKHWVLPLGFRARDAAQRYEVSDVESLHKQAVFQAEKFEVLTPKDVASLSKELRALDERCDYLRRTYKSLRAGRQKLHGRMMNYLRSDVSIFSRESLMKQEEVLADLDFSIDDWNSKLELAENRRLRVRQKLLEHVAAAVTLTPTAAGPIPSSQLTPPGSPQKGISPTRAARGDVESIQIYADGDVLNLFNSIEKAIGNMCTGTEEEL